LPVILNLLTCSNGAQLKTNFVLIDLENVHPDNFGLMCGGPFKIKVFLGANQSKIPLDMARALQQFGADAEYIKIEGNGSNALDFHIAYYIGRLSLENPEAYFHVISKDTGFDPLIKHLKAQKISCHRYSSISDIPLIKKSNIDSASNKIEAVIDNLSKQKAAKPRTVKTLRSSIKALFSGLISDGELDVLIEQLSKCKAIKITEGKVQYELSHEKN
jgi:hypothetical protein